MGSKQGTSGSGGGGGQDRGQNVTHQDMAAEQRKQRERDIEAYYPENFPIDTGSVGGYAGGGSIYKNRYINGNWS